MEEIVKSIIYSLNFGSNELSLIIISALPIIELRGAIPIGILLFEMHPINVFYLCCLGNIIPIVPLLLFFGKVEEVLQKHKFSNAFLQWYIEKVKKRTGIIERFELVGLALFVSIPLPVTGAWTGSVAAFIMGIKWKKAFLSICCGVLIAGIVVTVLTLSGYSFYSFLKQ